MSPRSPRLASLLLAPALALSVPIAAQEFAPSEAVGLANAPDGLAALGLGWVGEFHADRVVLFGALGEAAPRTVGLELRLQSIRVGDEPFVEGGEVAPRADGEDAVYARAGGVEERYEVRPEGLYQSFVFPERPAASGDLVVRLAVDTELELVLDGGVPSFVEPGVATFTVGEVLGVDAAGARVAGERRWVDGALELVLPATFVRDATYPLVLDPLLALTTTLGNTTYSNAEVDVAYDATNDVYLAVWIRRLSSGGSQVWSQRVSSLGLPVANSLTQVMGGGSTTLFADARVASLNGPDDFLVAFEGVINGFPSAVWVAEVDAATGAVGGPVVATSSSNAVTSPDVGGSRLPSVPEGVVVFDQQGVGIVARKVTTSTVGFPVLGPAIVVQPESLFQFPGRPTITSSNGNVDRHFVAWTSSGLVGGVRVHGRTLEPGGTLGPVRGDLLPGVGNVTDPRVEGNGQSYWLTATADGAGNDDVLATYFQDSGAGFVAGGVYPLATTFLDETAARPAWNGDTTVVAYQRGAGVQVVSLDQAGASLCEQPETVAASITFAAFAGGVASQWNGGGSGDGALIAWHEHPLSGGDAVRARLYVAPDEPTDLGGGCNFGGIALASCTVEENYGFTPRLVFAPAFSPAFLITSLNAWNASCGSCTLVPALDPTHFVIATSTGDGGSAELNVPIPIGTSGATAYLQWLTVNAPGSSGCGLLGGDVALSNALQLDVQ